MGELSKALAGKYEVLGIEPGIVINPKVGEVDLRTATVKQADALIAAGSKHLRNIDKKADAEAAKTPTDKK